ncbi:Uncharacterised protein [uncultured archaeon]|nr:Uncharacterised protein [uncultured archaeon]
MEENTYDTAFTNASKSPPAFAGVLVDWHIGPREITATIIDLIAREFLGVGGNKVFITGKSTGLRDFEKKFIAQLFVGKQSLQFEEVQEIAYKKLSNELVRTICGGLIDEGLVDKGFQKKLAIAVKTSMEETIGRDFKMPKNAQVIVLPEWILKPIFTVIGMQPVIDSIEKKALGKMGGSYEEALLTEKGKNAKMEALALKEFMTKYQMAEDRLANELVGHAISFGIGKTWMQKLGGKNAQLAKFVEQLESNEENMMKFIDMDAYLKAFQ